MPFTVLAALAFVPSAIRYLLETSSMAVGLVAVCAGLFSASFIGILPRIGAEFVRYCAVLLALMIAIMVHLVVTSLWFQPDYGRAGLSLLLLAISLVGAATCASSVFRDDAALERAIYWICGCFILVALFGLAGIAPPSGLASERPLFPFTEPSHFALTLMPFLAFVCVRLRGPGRYAVLVVVAIFAYFIKSLSLIVGLVILGAVLLPIGYAAALAGIALVALQFIDLDYFSERVDLSQETTNLSALIYRQGWELVRQSFDITKGFGIGFQQLGVAPVTTPTSDIIFRLAHEDSNLQDAGFAAAKIMTEFGIFGLLVTICYVIALINASLRLRKMIKDESPRVCDTFAYCAVVGYSIEFLVRGIGYFSGTTVFLIASMVYLTHARSSRNQARLPINVCDQSTQRTVGVKSLA